MDAIANYLMKIFSTTDYLFRVSTTWQYMLFFSLMLLVFAEERGGFIGALVTIVALIVNLLGIIYYLMVLFKYMWSLA